MSPCKFMWVHKCVSWDMRPDDTKMFASYAEKTNSPRLDAAGENKSETHAQQIEQRNLATSTEKAHALHTKNSIRTRVWHSQDSNQPQKSLVPATKMTNMKLYKCGGSYPHQGDCPAKGVLCNNYGKWNYYAKVCRFTILPQGETNLQQRHQDRVNDLKMTPQKMTILIFSQYDLREPSRLNTKFSHDATSSYKDIRLTF